MKRVLPPLKAVLAFESAARNASFKKAGEELCVTSSAISHQVRALEEWLGITLFERSSQSATLTDYGKRYMRDLGPLLDLLEKISTAERTDRAGHTKKKITIQTTDSFAVRWLVPRLLEFSSLHPDIGLKIVTYDFRDDLHSSEADLGIVFLRSNDGGAADASSAENVRLLFAEEIFPVCSPVLLQKRKSISLKDLSNFTLIHDDNVGVSWKTWLHVAMQRVATTLINIDDGPHYNHAHLALHAAELGNGITLASNVLTADARKNGRLVAPFQDKIVTGCGYYLAWPGKTEVEKECRQFIDWIVSASAEH